MFHRNEWCLSFEGVILCKAVPQASQLPHLHPGQPGRAVTSGLQQPGGHLHHHGTCDRDHGNNNGTTKKVRSSELSGDAVETKNLLR